LRGVDLNADLWVMSPQEYGISTTYKTRVDTYKACKECLRSLIGQLEDSHDLERKFCNFERFAASQ